ncbi:MAG: precorrin-6y C5,15-methyltransferase (decarboxylating) subunit CbiE [Nitrospirae bacterium]|nr:precorrin-6y C5,15-methyltransferase (decarboxylating) subunit CbiE [Nitrospirota bacterium]MBF0534986.1 precorrin-6y C5,15-methyltransferase (decarboxylating) subunit CbiE [Nitrospirota bacterium]MBF0617162.1 precorrin-6y C5,15-methyltransferase (decarboxylating) subunit CbiE [Nitrospirota bacterium]
MHRITLIGVGPGGSDYVTFRAVKSAQNCEVLIGMKHQIAAIGEITGKVIYEESGIEEILNLIGKNEGKAVGVLITGDAGIYSLSEKIMERFGRDSVTEIVPGISSVMAAFSKVKQQWLNVRIISVHGRPLNGLNDAPNHERVAILCDRKNNSPLVVKTLSQMGILNRSKTVYVCRNITCNNEQIIEVNTIADLNIPDDNDKEVVLIVPRR